MRRLPSASRFCRKNGRAAIASREDSGELFERDVAATAERFAAGRQLGEVSKFSGLAGKQLSRVRGRAGHQYGYGRNADFTTLDELGVPCPVLSLESLMSLARGHKN